MKQLAMTWTPLHDIRIKKQDTRDFVQPCLNKCLSDYRQDTDLARNM